MTIQDWAASKLTEDGFKVDAASNNGLLIATRGKERLIVVAETSPPVFSLDELDAILEAYPGCEAVTLVKRFPAEDVMEDARDRGVLVDSWGNVVRALSSAGPMHRFQHPDEEYLRSRIERHRNVSGMVRVGLSAWRVERTGLRDLVIITHGRYEFPVDELHRLLSEHPNLEPDAFVITNPYSNGLSKRVIDAAAQTEVEIYLLNDFFTRLAKQ